MDDLAMTQKLRPAHHLLATFAALGIITATFPASAAPIDLTTTGDNYFENFNSLAGSGASQTVPAGWSFAEFGVGADFNYAADNGSGSTKNTYSYGTGTNTERGLGTLVETEFSTMFGAQFKNLTGAPITSFDISYRGEVWRLGTTALLDKLDFQYSTNANSVFTGTWTNFDPLDFSTAFLNGQNVSIGAHSGNSAGFSTQISSTIPGLNIANGNTFWIRWVDSVMAEANDDGLAIDQFSITPVPEPASLAIAAGAAIVGITAASARRRKGAVMGGAL
jgi:hypothetical protein